MAGEPGAEIPGVDKDLYMIFAGIEALRELAAEQDPPKANLRLSQTKLKQVHYLAATHQAL